MNVRNIDPNAVTLYEKNAKFHPQSQIDRIAKSIERFGFRQPVVIDGNGVVIAGHGRVLAARQIGLTEIPCEIADDLTQEQAKALRLIDNKLNESKWKDRALKFELLDISPEIGLDEFGFDMPDMLPRDESTDNVPYQDEDVLRGAYEYSGESFSDDQFQCQCPECGFRFNP